jgi:hypothetical protein
MTHGVDSQNPDVLKIGSKARFCKNLPYKGSPFEFLNGTNELATTCSEYREDTGRPYNEDFETYKDDEPEAPLLGKREELAEDDDAPARIDDEEKE